MSNRHTLVICQLCSEETSSDGGQHHLVTLKCGHPFGHHCLLTHLTKRSSCPQCCASAQMQDVRRLFIARHPTRHGSGADQNALEQAQAKCRKLQRQIARTEEELKKRERELQDACSQAAELESTADVAQRSHDDYVQASAAEANRYRHEIEAAQHAAIGKQAEFDDVSSRLTRLRAQAQDKEQAFLAACQQKDDEIRDAHQRIERLVAAVDSTSEQYDALRRDLYGEIEQLQMRCGELDRALASAEQQLSEIRRNNNGAAAAQSSRCVLTSMAHVAMPNGNADDQTPFSGMSTPASIHESAQQQQQPPPDPAILECTSMFARPTQQQAQHQPARSSAFTPPRETTPPRTVANIAVAQSYAAATASQAPPTPQLSFKRFNFKSELYEGISFASNLRQPTDLQLSLLDREHQFNLLQQHMPNLVVQGAPGAGKTTAALIAALQRIRSASPCQALFIVPTTELANQIHRQACDLSRHMRGIRVCRFVAKTRMSLDVEEFERHGQPAVVIGTLGRLLLLQKNNYLRLDGVRQLFIDEADAMLTDDTKYLQVVELMEKLPKEAQIYALTTVLPTYLHKPLQSVLDERSRRRCSQAPAWLQTTPKERLIPDSVQQYYVEVDSEEHKQTILMGLVKMGRQRTLVFCHQLTRANWLADQLTAKGHSCGRLVAEQSQQEREDELQRLKAGERLLVVCTSIVARGLDLPELSAVVNFDWPGAFEDYVLRVGRIGRRGRPGVAISFVEGAEELNKVRALERFYSTRLTPLPNNVDQQL